MSHLGGIADTPIGTAVTLGVRHVEVPATPSGCGTLLKYQETTRTSQNEYPEIMIRPAFAMLKYTNNSPQLDL
jgi:hypothetical protein